MKKTYLLVILIALCGACSTTQVIKSKGVSVPAGTVVPYGKVSNQAFAEEYIDADVIVNCQFFSSSSLTAGSTIKKMPKDHFAFQVTDLGIDPKRNEFTGALEGLVIFAPMEYSDLIFSLEKGDKLRLRGGTIVTKLTLGSISGVNTRYVHFKANSIEKL